MIFVHNVYAKELPTITVGSYNAYIGEKITIPVNLSNNEGVSFLGFKIEFDTESLEYVDSKINGLENAQLKEIDINDKNIITLYALTIDEEKTINDNGEIATLTFKVKEDAKSSEIKINVTDYGNANLEQLERNSSNGNVKILIKMDSGEKIQIEKDDNVASFETSDSNIATVDEEGNINFKKNGEVTIISRDKEGNILEEKTYKVKDKEENSGAPKTSKSKIFVGISVLTVVCLVTFILIKFFLKKKN